jgi:cobyrinic acid a,c-diamide synthase
MGLIPFQEHGLAAKAIAKIASVVEAHVDLEAVLSIAEEAVLTSLGAPVLKKPIKRVAGERQPRIGIIRDSAFQFYYPENIEALAAAGAELVFSSPLDTKSLPALDALYIGGGFPETHAKLLAENQGFRDQLHRLANDGLPIYAECGGLMYLAEALVLKGTVYPMAGVLPIVFGLSKRPQGHGYTVIRVNRENPYFDLGTECRGHEFHYSRVLKWRGRDEDFAFVMKRGNGILDKKDGLVYKNVLATYTHLHVLGAPFWAEAMVRNALKYAG